MFFLYVLPLMFPLSFPYPPLTSSRLLLMFPYLPLLLPSWSPDAPLIFLSRPPYPLLLFSLCSPHLSLIFLSCSPYLPLSCSGYLPIRSLLSLIPNLPKGGPGDAPHPLNAPLAIALAHHCFHAYDVFVRITALVHHIPLQQPP